MRTRAAAPPRVRIKRVYEEPAGDDGRRILIDRLWPRGIAKAALKLDAWQPEIAPSNELRRWYSHDPAKFKEFRRRYEDELAPHAEAIADLQQTVRAGRLTLLTSTREVDLSHAYVLRDIIEAGAAAPRRPRKARPARSPRR